MKKKPRSRTFKLFLLLILLGVGLELTSRVFLCLAFGASLFRPDSVIHHYYPDLEKVRRERQSGDEDRFHVLVLGGSVLHPSMGEAVKLLEENLEKARPGRVKVHNLANLAHCSMDSCFKYLRLADCSFDLVLFYHGINEVRANNCPTEVFREDYGHYSWYREIHRVRAHGELAFLAFPYVLHYAGAKVIDYFEPPRILDTNYPDSEWLRFGKDIKTAPVFERNVRTLVETAGERGEILLPATFCYYLPEGYSMSRFKANLLDYAKSDKPFCAADLWGSPPHVVKGIESHNRILRGLAGDHPRVRLLDLQRLLPAEGTYFCDICHLSPEGSRFLADAITKKIITIMDGE